MKMSIKAARINRGLTVKAVCEQLGIYEKTLMNWEAGKNAPRIDKAHELAELYGCDLNDLIFLS